MKITLLESDSVTLGDIDFSPLYELGEVVLFDTAHSKKLPDIISDSDIVIINKTAMTRELIEKCPKLKMICLMATGYNNVDTGYCKEHGIVVSNIPNYSTDSVATLTAAFILQFATNLFRYSESVKKGDWVKSDIFSYFGFPMLELRGKTLGIFGMGTIGRRVAGIFSAFGMNIIYTSRSEKDLPYERVSADALFSRSDFISLHAPLTPETEKIISKDSISKMHDGVFIVNTARGGLINEKDLADAIRSGKVAGFAADVLTEEPQSASSPFFGLENVFITPHIAWASCETRRRLFGILIQNIKSFISGIPINNVAR